MLRTCFYCVIWMSVCLSACRVNFNFTGGGTINPDLQTLSVDLFGNEADIVVPYLAQEMTNQLQDRFLSQSRLSLTSGTADIMVSGSVVRYTLVPVAIAGNQADGEPRAEQNRLTIGVRIKYDNNVEPNDSWEQTFSSFVDFDASLDFTSVEREKIEEILEQLTQDIFNKSLGKW